MRHLLSSLGRSIPARVADRACGPRNCRAISSAGASADPLNRSQLRLLAKAAHVDGSMPAASDNYHSWTKDGLIQRLKELEGELAKRPAPPAPAVQLEPPSSQDGNATASASAPAGDPAKAKVKGKGKGKRKIDPSGYSTRYIALKLAYLGKRYGGFEFQASSNQPTIEEELWRALVKACLVFPPEGESHVVDFDRCSYSKCGRTDRGVSAFGQVIGLRVRSARPLPKKRPRLDEGAAAAVEGAAPTSAEGRPEEGVEDAPEPEKPFDDIWDELPYARILNRLLPEDIRVLAWCPSPPPGFSARFSCRERQYRYFFTQPAFHPPPTQLEPHAAAAAAQIKPGWLDIEAMRDAARRFEGEHDFRNVCKIDPAKLITNFKRHIFEASIEEVADASTALPFLHDAALRPAGGQMRDGEPLPKVYAFKVRGSAFLWHQIRHMVAVLFLVGQRLEAPSVVDDLLDVGRTPGKPSYVMADEVPLVLWDCVFPDLDGGDDRDDGLRWVYVGDNAPGHKYSNFGLMDSLWEAWRGRKMDELLAGQLLQQVAAQGSPAGENDRKGEKGSGSVKLFEGGNNGRLGGKYVPMVKKDMQQPPDEQNEKYAKRKGYAGVEDMRAEKSMRGGKAEEAEADE